MQRFRVPISQPDPIPMDTRPELTGVNGGASVEETLPSGNAVFSETEWATLARSLQVSEREFQILRFVFDDRTKMQIAEVLGISSHTVHTYLGRLYRKVGVSSREQLLVRTFAEFRRLFDRKH